MNGPKLGRPSTDPEEAKRHKKLEWLESGERGEIERNFGVGKRRYSLDYRYQAEGDQQSDDPFHCALHEPAEEAPASFSLFFRLASNHASELAEKAGFPIRLNHGICAGDTK